MMNLLVGALVDSSCKTPWTHADCLCFPSTHVSHVFPQVTPVKFQQNPSPQVWSVNLCTPDPSTWHGGNLRGPPSQCHPKSNNKSPAFIFFGRDYDVAKPIPHHHLQCFFFRPKKMFFLMPEKKTNNPFGVGEKVEVQVKPEKLSHYHGIVGCNDVPLPTYPYGKSLYKPYIVGINGL